MSTMPEFPRDFWLGDWEPSKKPESKRRREATFDFHLTNSLEAYRRLRFMMVDRDVVAVSPSSVLARARASRPAGEMEWPALKETN